MRLPYDCSCRSHVCAAFLAVLVAWAWCGAAQAEESGLIRVGDAWRFLRGVQEPVGGDWRRPEFDDSAWGSGPGGFGFGDLDDATDFADMYGAYSSIYLRRKFSVADPAQVRWLVFRADYEDGFCVYLNGTEVMRRNLAGDPGSPVAFNARANSWRTWGVAEDFDLTAFRHLLVAGENTLAVQIHDDAAGSYGVSFVPELLANFQRGPFLQAASETSIKVVWRTPVAASSVVEFGLTPSLGQSAVGTPATAEHMVQLTGLTPGTLYHYRVRSVAGANDAVSDIRTFRTLKSSGPVRFGFLADSGGGSRAQHNIARVLRTLDPDLVLHGGDVVYPSFVTGLADTRCLSVYQRHMQDTPYYFTFGNHDIYSGELHYLTTFHLPTNQVTGTEHFYSFDHGDVHFVAVYQPMVHQYLLVPGGVQHNWLAADLAASRKPWKVVFLHHPMMTSAHHRFDDENLNGIMDLEEVKRGLLPLCRDMGVQVVLSGHAHVFERFAPTNGVHQVISGVSGGTPYPFIERDASSAQFWSRQHCSLITVEGDELRVEAYDEAGVRFDQMVIRRAPAPVRTYQAAWHTPTPPPPGVAVDGNMPGEVFDVAGEPIPSMPGEFSNLGRVRVDNDLTHLHIGMEQMMFHGDNDVILFLEVPGLVGVTNLVGLGNGLVDPTVEGVDGLDFLENLSFTNFTPSVACVVGDEYADGTARAFQRPAGGFAAGQGVFRLQSGLSSVPAAGLRQFNRSPQGAGEAGEQNADLVVVSIPLAELGGLRAGDLIRVAVVVGGGQVDTNAAIQSRFLDRSFVGAMLTGYGTGRVVVEGIPVRLAPEPDADHDGLTTEEELVLGLDPLRPDTDNDGMKDGWEVVNGFNPLSAPGEGEGDGDADGDRLTNGQEHALGSDPRDPASGLQFGIRHRPGGGVQMWWNAAVGWRFRVQRSGNPAAGYVDMEGFPRTATATMETLDVTGPDLAAAAQFYRLVFVP